MRKIIISVIALGVVSLLVGLYVLAETTNQWYQQTKSHQHYGWVTIHNNGVIEIESNERE